MNITDYILENDLPHKMVNGVMHQTEDLYLIGVGITSLNGFVQNGFLDLSHNAITSVDGFVQNGELDLSYNKITSLNGFVQNGELDLRFNLIKNTKNVFTNPKTKRVVIYNPKLKTYSCGCFYQKSEQEFIEKCRYKGFTEVLEHFKLN